MLPQSAQYLLPSALANPQFGHFSTPVLCRGGPLMLAPHSPQNLVPSGFLAPQLGHLNAIPPISPDLRYCFSLGRPLRCLASCSLIRRFLLLGSLSCVIALLLLSKRPFLPMHFAHDEYGSRTMVRSQSPASQLQAPAFPGLPYTMVGRYTCIVYQRHMVERRGALGVLHWVKT